MEIKGCRRRAGFSLRLSKTARDDARSVAAGRVATRFERSLAKEGSPVVLRGPPILPFFYCGGGSGRAVCAALPRMQLCTSEGACAILGREQRFHARLHRIATKSEEKCLPGKEETTRPGANPGRPIMGKRHGADPDYFRPRTVIVTRRFLARPSRVLLSS